MNVETKDIMDLIRHERDIMRERLLGLAEDGEIHMNVEELLKVVFDE